MPNANSIRSRLTDEHYARCLELALKHIASYGSIRNRELRHVSGIGYDQAIYFFNRAVAEKLLHRKGTASNTHYDQCGDK